jgi:hypothetical protein
VAIFHAAGGPALLARHARRLLAFFDDARLIDDQHGLRVTQMLDDIGAQLVAEGIRIPDRPSQQMLDAVRGGVAIDFGELPAVFTLYRAESTPEICPGAPSGFAPGTLGPNPSLHLRLPQCPGAYRVEGHVFWKHTLLLPQFHGSVLRQRCGTIITY